MSRAPDNATYISDAQPMYISQEEAARYNADPVPYSGKQTVNIYNSPSGITNSVQFLRTATDFGGDTGFTYNPNTSAVNIQGNLNIGGLINGKFHTNFANFRISGGNAGQVLSTNGNGNLSWTTFPEATPSDWNANSGVAQILNKPNLQVYLTTSTFNSTINNYVTTSNLNSRFANLSTVATTGSYNDLINKPNLSNLAISGSYSDLAGRPNIPDSIFDLDVPNVSVHLPAYLYYTGSNLSWQKIDYASVQGTPTLSTVATTGNYNDLSNKPANVSHFINDANYVQRTEMESFVANQIAIQINAIKGDVSAEFDTLKELFDAIQLNLNVEGGGADIQFTGILDGGNA